MSALKWDAKDPQDVADYQVNWADRLGDDDTIVTSAWTVPSGITKDSDSSTDTTTTIWLSGGTAGTSYTFINHVITAGGREWDQSVKIAVKDK